MGFTGKTLGLAITFVLASSVASAGSFPGENDLVRAELVLKDLEATSRIVATGLDIDGTVLSDLSLEEAKYEYQVSVKVRLPLYRAIKAFYVGDLQTYTENILEFEKLSGIESGTDSNDSNQKGWAAAALGLYTSVVLTEFGTVNLDAFQSSLQTDYDGYTTESDYWLAQAAYYYAAGDLSALNDIVKASSENEFYRVIAIYLSSKLHPTPDSLQNSENLLEMYVPTNSDHTQNELMGAIASLYLTDVYRMLIAVTSPYPEKYVTKGLKFSRFARTHLEVITHAPYFGLAHTYTAELWAEIYNSPDNDILIQRAYDVGRMFR